MQPSKRCFIAVEIPAEIQKSLHRVILNTSLTPENGFRPVRPGMIHITLKFLGDTLLSLLPGIQQGLSEIAANFQPFEVQVKGVGAFASWDHPKTIWAGLIFPPQLNNLAARINQFCSSLGFAAEKRPFSAHLTLARVSDYPHRERLKQTLERLRQFENTGFGITKVTGITLFQSTLGTGGSVYTPISCHEFNGDKV